jgi:hypothetical protein
MNPSLLLWSVTLLAGVGIGHFIPRGQTTLAKEEVPSVSNTGPRSLLRSSVQTSGGVTPDFFKAISVEDSDELDKLLKDIPPGDRMAYLDAILDASPPEALCSSFEWTIHGLLKEEFAEDPQAIFIGGPRSEVSGKEKAFYHEILEPLGHTPAEIDAALAK